MKKRLLPLLLVMMLGLFALASCAFPLPGETPPPTAPQEEKDEQGLLYTLKEDGTYAVSVGDAGAATALTIPATFKDKPVTEIAESAFMGCTSLKNIAFTEGNLLSVGASAFRGCSALESIRLPESTQTLGARAFHNCESLASVGLGGVTEIGDYAFYNCRALGDPSLTEGLLSIGGGAFYNCKSFVSVSVPASVVSIGEAAFAGCDGIVSLSIPFVGAQKGGTQNTELSYIFRAIGTNAGAEAVPESLSAVVLTGGESIAPFAFAGCTSIKAITIPASVKSIGKDAFSGCISLENVFAADLAAWCAISFATETANPMHIATALFLGEEEVAGALTVGAEIESIAPFAFYGCEKITALSVESGVTSIGTLAFAGCTGLESVSIAESVARIGISAFKNCNAMQVLTVPFTGEKKGGEENTHLGYIFGSKTREGSAQHMPETLKTVILTGTVVPPSAFYECKFVESIQLTEGVQTLSGHAFSTCLALKSITIPESVKTIGAYCFQYCVSLESVTIPDGVTTAGTMCFYQCEGLVSVSIGRGLAEISDSMFKNCALLSEVTIAQDGALSVIGPEGFYDCKTLGAIDLPENLTLVREKAFGGCVKLSAIVIPDKVRAVYNSAFLGCSRLSSVSLGASVRSLGMSAFDGCPVRYTSYSNASYLGNAENPYLVLVSASVRSYSGYTVHENTKVIADGAFSTRNITAIRLASYEGSTRQVVKLPLGLESIGSSAFSECSNLSVVELPEGIGSIGTSAFSKCGNLQSVNIPSTVTYIGGLAFEECGKLTKVHIPDAVITVDDCAFLRCESLAEVVIGKGVESINNAAFGECKALERIFYRGESVSEWGEIFISDFQNEWILNAEVYCYSETEPQGEGLYWQYGTDGVTIVILGE